MEAGLKVKTLVFFGDQVFERLEAVLQSMKAFPKSISIGRPSYNSYCIIVGYVICDTAFRIVNHETTFPAWPVDTEDFNTTLSTILNVWGKEADNEAISCFCVYNDFEDKVNVLAVYKKAPSPTLWDHLQN